MLHDLLHSSVGLAVGAVFVLGAVLAGVAVAHIVSPAWHAFAERLWGR